MHWKIIRLIHRNYSSYCPVGSCWYWYRMKMKTLNTSNAVVVACVLVTEIV